MGVAHVECSVQDLRKGQGQRRKRSPGGRKVRQQLAMVLVVQLSLPGSLGKAGRSLGLNLNLCSTPLGAPAAVVAQQEWGLCSTPLLGRGRRVAMGIASFPFRELATIFSGS